MIYKIKTIDPDEFIRSHIDQSLIGLIVVSVVAIAILLFRLLQYGSSAILAVQLTVAASLLAVLLFRRHIPSTVLLTGIVGLMMALTGLAVMRFGLATPALLIFTVVPIVVGAVQGLRAGLFTAGLLVTVVIVTGVMHTSGRLDSYDTLLGYLQKPANWIIYIVAYLVMVSWGIVLADSLSRFWRASYNDLKLAHARVEQEQQIAAELHRHKVVGQLSGGVAHEFNNILAVVSANAETVKILSRAGDYEAVDESIDSVIHACHSGTELTRSMLAFAHSAALKPSLVNLNEVVEDILGLIVRTLPDSIELKTSLDSDIEHVLLDGAMLSSALLNLVLNARESMPDGGEISIETRSRTFDGTDYVEVVVTDNGIGISKETESKIYDPFFTTKDRALNSGLGLSMVQGFVKQSNGEITFKSSESSTSFVMRFETDAAKETTTTPADNITEIKGRHKCKVLIVEDDKAVRDATRRLLKACGYEVHTAPSGDRAWQLITDGLEADVVLSDVVLPGTLQGTDLAMNLKQRIQSPPVVLVSGHTFDEVHGIEGSLKGNILMKPVSKTDLINALEAAMNQEC